MAHPTLGPRAEALEAGLADEIQKFVVNRGQPGDEGDDERSIDEALGLDNFIRPGQVENPKVAQMVERVEKLRGPEVPSSDEPTEGEGAVPIGDQETGELVDGLPFTRENFKSLKDRHANLKKTVGTQGNELHDLRERLARLEGRAEAAPQGVQPPADLATVKRQIFSHVRDTSDPLYDDWSQAFVNVFGQLPEATRRIVEPMLREAIDAKVGALEKKMAAQSAQASLGTVPEEAIDALHEKFPALAAVREQDPAQWAHLVKGLLGGNGASKPQTPPRRDARTYVEGSGRSSSVASSEAAVRAEFNKMPLSEKRDFIDAMLEGRIKV